jgi:membrane-bound lytic murein transglycosylase F
LNLKYTIHGIRRRGLLRLNHLVWVLLVLITATVCDAAGSYEGLIRIDRYDHHFQEFSRRYFGAEFDWRLFKAQAIAESRLDPKAISSEGAVGLMQILPKTFRQIKQENDDISGEIQDPRSNIAAGIYYDRTLWKLWEKERPFRDRVRFMLGAYNAGREALLEAQQVAIKRKLNPFLWSSMKRALPSVIGAEYRQTVAYVDKVFRIRELIKGRLKACGSGRTCGGQGGERGGFPAFSRSRLTLSNTERRPRMRRSSRRFAGRSVSTRPTKMVNSPWPGSTSIATPAMMRRPPVTFFPIR